LTTADPGLSLPDDLRRTAGQRYLRGLFTGGTLCYQSQQILRQAGLTVFSNAPLSADGQLQDAAKSVGHTLIDMGDDEHTRGRLHPMIDGTLRAQRIIKESLDPETAILLLDFILGTNVAEDPVGDIVGAIGEGRRQRPMEAGGLTAWPRSVGPKETRKTSRDRRRL
jgi:FdrA protein